ARRWRVERKPRHGMAKCFPFGDGPGPAEVPSRVERALRVEQSHPKRRERADPAPAATVGAAHFKETLQAHLGKGSREMIRPVDEARTLPGQCRELPFEEIAEALARGIDIVAVPEHEIHRHVERIVAVAFVAEAFLEDER